MDEIKLTGEQGSLDRGSLDRTLENLYRHLEEGKTAEKRVSMEIIICSDGIEISGELVGYDYMFPDEADRSYIMMGLIAGAIVARFAEAP